MAFQYKIIVKTETAIGKGTYLCRKL